MATQFEFFNLEVTQVLETALDSREMVDVVLNIYNIEPANVEPPFTFVGAVAKKQIAELENISVIIDPNDPTQIDVKADVLIPLRVFFTDANNVSAHADAVLTVCESFQMDRPSLSIFPYGFDTMVAVSGARGYFDSCGTLTVSLCVVVLIKLTVEEIVRMPYVRFVDPNPLRDPTDCNIFLTLPFYPEIPNSPA